MENLSIAERPWWLEHFPWTGKYPKPLPNQEEGFYFIGQRGWPKVMEAPTGSGKTLIGYTFLRAGLAQGEQPLFFVTPNKTLVQQIQNLHPDVQVAYGRGEHQCLYYGPEHPFRANEIPCLLLDDCPNRVDQDTGETFEPGAERCPYYDQKWRAKQGGIVVSTMSFYLFTHLFSKEFLPPARLVIDEAHRIAEVVRSSLSYEITDYHLRLAVKLFKDIGAREEAKQLARFTRRMIHMIKRRSPRSEELLKDEEVVELIDLLQQVDGNAAKAKIREARKAGVIDTFEKNEILTKVQEFLFDLRRYINSLEYSRFTDKRRALNYTCAYWVEEKDMPEGKRVQYKLVIKAYHVAPIIRRLLGERTLAMSATIGDPDQFGFETGISDSFHSLSSDFPVKNTRVFLPTDVADLSYNVRPKNEPNHTLRQIIRTAKFFAGKGLRSLVVLISEAERQKFLKFSEEEGLSVVSYGNGIPAKEAAERFREGAGDVLVGTAAHFGEGVDLPKNTAPIIFFLRPGYPRPQDPLAQFEERRYSLSRIWGLRKYRVMNQALQVRGRNVRSKTDLGVCFFMSRQFKGFLEQSLPKDLRQAYVKGKTFEQCVQEALKLLAA